MACQIHALLSLQQQEEEIGQQLQGAAKTVGRKPDSHVEQVSAAFPKKQTNCTSPMTVIDAICKGKEQLVSLL